MTEPTLSSTEVATLIVEGNAALIAGDSYGARQRFRRALELDPERIEAWIGLAGSVRPYREKREHLRRALELDPRHAEARVILDQVEAKIAAGEVLAPGGVQVRDPLPEALAPPPPEEPVVETVAATDVIFCYTHPDRETGLQCTSCERPICGECATRAAVGQLCPECTRARLPVNYQVSTTNLLVAGTIALVAGAILSVLALQIIGAIGFFGLLVAFLLGPVTGDLLVRLIGRATQEKRGRQMQLAVSICFALGAMPLFSLFLLTGFVFSIPALATILFVVITITTAMARLR
ncbi:MAG: hypothetical protein AB4911_05770 [Oscillochloridaceae bacterium umkhey_bin13]